MDIFKISLNSDWQFAFTVNLLAVAIAISIVLVLVFSIPRIRRRFLLRGFDVDEVLLGIGDSKVKLKPNSFDLQIAYKLWVELKTRKLGLIFEEDHDVISEVYNSWYEFFGVTRELIKEIPVAKLRANESTQRLVLLSVDILNKAIRPHLTRWQARFRRWNDHEIAQPENLGKTMQEIQQKFPEYAELVKDLKNTNSRLVAYSNLLADLLQVTGNKEITRQMQKV